MISPERAERLLTRPARVGGRRLGGSLGARRGGGFVACGGGELGGGKTASVLLRFLIGYGEIDPRFLSGAGEVNLKFRLVVKDSKKDDEKKRVEGGIKKGFQVSRAYGDVEAPVGELWIGKTAYFKVNKEELRRLVEDAKRTAPDLPGIKKIRQTLEWLSTDVSFIGRQILGSAARIWQLRWYLTLFGGGGQAEAWPASLRRASSSTSSCTGVGRTWTTLSPLRERNWSLSSAARLRAGGSW
jgi:hypothetical protein